MTNKKLHPPRSSGRLDKKFLEIAWQYDTMLDQALRKITLVDSGNPLKNPPLGEVNWAQKCRGHRVHQASAVKARKEN